VINRDNAVGLILLLFCAVVAGVLLYGIATGTRFHWTGPAWAGPLLFVIFLGASLWGLTTRPGRRWRWPWERNRDGQNGTPGSDR
jgi:hypothetical protein